MAESTPRQLHHRAMDLAEQGDMCRRAGRYEEARVLYQEAYELENQAAERTTLEPSRTILRQSADNLAAAVARMAAR